MHILLAHSIFGQNISKTNQEKLSFNRDIRPLLADRCFACHGPDANKRAAELRLDVPLDSTMQERKIIVAAQPEASELVNRIESHAPEFTMPPPDSGKELSPVERELLKEWIRQGATYEDHWSWAPLNRPIQPAVEDHATGPFSTNPIDAFLTAQSLAPSVLNRSPAEPYTLLRRLCFDLTGLPPTAADLDWLSQQIEVSRVTPNSFNSDSIDWNSLIDRKLASPAFGERMAIWWLDLVRYADTVGYHGDQEHHAAPYRDWVIRAFNDNLPFNTFSEFQLAGDLIPDAGELGKIASAYNRLLQTSHEGGLQPKEYLAKYSADRVRNFSQVWLGLTVGCAECHDHKFDPITQREFYQLAAFFADLDETQTFKGGDTSPTKRFPEMDVTSPLDGSTKMRVMVSSSIEPRVIRVLPRGNWLDESGDIVQPQVPEILSNSEARLSRTTRLDLARWLFEENQALTARVTVNRVWALFFGRGLSTSLEDYGSQGTPPSHPELLDWLASEWIASGWDIKQLVRMIVQSDAYRRSTPFAQIDRSFGSRDQAVPFEAYLYQTPRRLPAESLRDSMLQHAGLIDFRRGGPPVRPYQPDGYYSHLNFPPRSYTASLGGDQYRRGVYTHWQRQFLHPMLKNFDAPSREECTARRNLSNTPTQMLVLLNDPSLVEAARAFAWSTWIRFDPNTEQLPRRIAEQLWLLALSRPVSDAELEVLLALYQKQIAIFREHPEERNTFLKTGQWQIPHFDTLSEERRNEVAAWGFVARSLFMLNESITLY